MEPIRITNQQMDEERALYGRENIVVEQCQFDGPADGESALKECRNVEVKEIYFNLRYPCWHDVDLTIQNSEMTGNCRAALWYSSKIAIENTKLHGIKALRECDEVTMKNCDVISPEFGWSVRGIDMEDTKVESEYFMMRSSDLRFNHVNLQGKYSFQYVEDATITNCNFNTKDAFWHAKHVTIKDSTIRGEYLAWYCEDVTFENCTIIGTQPFCYCKNLRLVNCQMLEADFAFEKSEVEATITTPVISIKNPAKGTIKVPSVQELIMDDPKAQGEVILS
ncbi:MAG: DUF3737 family protein [Lachnospiraceae bacterium]|nr:DUF3737 family protein [Lachnospiraceae bacterium]